VLARRLTREEHDAEDAVQDTLESAWKARRQIRDPDATGGWLRRIVARRIVDVHRRRADLPVGAAEELDSLIPDVEDPAAVLAAAADERVLRAALRELTPTDRIAIVLHDAEEWPVAKVDELLGIATEAAHKRVQRARARLVATLAQVDAIELEARRFGTLSRGEKQRVLLARALAQQTTLLILDEPTDNLDVQHQLEVLELVRSLRRIGLGCPARPQPRRELLQPDLRPYGREDRGPRPPADVLTAETTRDVFGVQAVPVTHPVAGRRQLCFSPLRPTDIHRWGRD